MRYISLLFAYLLINPKIVLNNLDGTLTETETEEIINYFDFDCDEKISFDGVCVNFLFLFFQNYKQEFLFQFNLDFKQNMQSKNNRQI